MDPGGPGLTYTLGTGYLRSHAGHLATLAKLRDQWHHERDEATEAARHANATVAKQGTAIDGLRWDIEQRGKLHQTQVLEMGAHATEELAAATEQHGAELAALRAEHDRSVAMLATERDANMTALQVRHEATLNDARAVGSDSGIRIAALTKELLEITDGQRERDEQCEQKVTEANKAVREANEWARGLQVRPWADDESCMDGPWPLTAACVVPVFCCAQPVLPSLGPFRFDLIDVD